MGGAAFQYPQSDRGRCNGLMTWKRSLPPSLSVSSVGSWALQHSPSAETQRKNIVFQYPQSDRGRCNVRRAYASILECWAFSILSRIVGAATYLLICGGGALLGLSVSSVGSWALQLDCTPPPQEMNRIFQYPQSDRGRCNLPLAVRMMRLYEAFSILSRIVGAATSTGASGRPSSRQLSVSSVGSWALQRTVGHRRGRTDRVFQYPQSDRGRCNALAPQAPPAPGPVFQYPQSDRGRCNLA